MIIFFQLQAIFLLTFFQGAPVGSVIATPNNPPEIVEGIEVYRGFSSLDYLFQQNSDTTYVINFWATWCKPCVEELPYFNRLFEEVSGEPVRIVLISLDFEHQISSKLAPFIKNRNLKPEVKVLLDPDANTWIPRVHPDWGGAIPVTLFYRGEETSFFEGQFEDYQQLKNIVHPMKNH